MSDTPEEESPEAEEQPFRVRNVFQFRRQPKAEPEAGPTVPPMPEYDPVIPAQAPVLVGRAAREGNHSVPNWWDPDKDITASAVPACKHPKPYTFTLQGTGEVIPHWCPDCETDLTPDVPEPKSRPTPRPTPTPAPVRSAGKACQHPEPHEVRAKPTGQLVAFWCADCETQLEVPDEYDELDEVAKEGGGESQEGGGEGQVPNAVRRRWTVRGTGKKTHARPVYGKTSDDGKKSGIEAWKALPGKTRHLLYNGVALGAGFYIGIPQFFTDEVAYLVAHYSSWTDFYVCVWYGVASAIWVLDHHTRSWFPPFALAARIPLVSMIVGVLLYGNPAA